ncbi:MAG: 50S ribosomal protein L32 [Candidatus Uhrbacteria bacterium GW2011_GWA2_52_8d]|uniref:Large ribosomal subunit protein bL32 n=1 Tax=Candidatus Uhrbacteria bacterium GW2011_GWA2_52_8d TaxID=1618979 RepID=A0A0G2AIL2_9BACT|nr:MAG: 50S ribosomal protein L32 [Candidatus Uhrbacteria bacterium GW2011_GWA2_52_8d]
MKPTNVGVCTTCQAPLLPHTACKNCGIYKGKQVIDTTRDMKREANKAVASVKDHDHDHNHEEGAAESKDEKAS